MKQTQQENNNLEITAEAAVAEIEKNKFKNITNIRSAYNLFYRDMKSKAGDTKVASKMVSEAWKVQEDKTYWKELASKERERFTQDALSAGFTQEQIDDKFKSKCKKRQMTPLKRPCNASIKYTNDNIGEVRSENGVSDDEIAIVAAHRWTKHIKKSTAKNTEFTSTDEDMTDFVNTQISTIKESTITPAEARIVLGRRWKALGDESDEKKKYKADAEERTKAWKEAKLAAEKET